MSTSLRLAPVLALLALPAAAQVQFSVSTPSDLVGTPDSGSGTPITDGDLLEPAGGAPALGPLLVPQIATLASAGLGLVAPANVDALSHGRDRRLDTAGAFVSGSCSLWFSTSASARSFMPVPLQGPTVWTETSLAASPEAGADVYVDTGSIGVMPAGPMALGGPMRHVGLFDGNGLASPFGSVFPGLGLTEPSLSGGAGGDVLDALDGMHDLTGPPIAGFFSLDAVSAAANGFAGGDILRSAPAGPLVYALATQLGLDIGGANTDDLDALAIWDDGDGIYEPYQELFNWGPNRDMVLFSVRSSSLVVGVPDSQFGMPISPGDVLVPPVAAGLPPRILVAAERIGLRTLRAGQLADDNLNALDVTLKPWFDCDGNGVEDACDIAAGTLADNDKNGLADACQVVTTYCTGLVHSGGCAAAIGWSGTPSLTGADDFHVTATSVLNSVPGRAFYGFAPAAIPFFGGTLCVQPPLKRLPVQFSFGSPPGVLDCSGAFDTLLTQAEMTAAGLLAGQTLYAQYWFRDAGAALGVGLSDALSAVIQP